MSLEENKGCLFALVRLFRGKPETESAGTAEEYPYDRAEFLSPAEQAYFRVLQAAVSDRYYVFAKVRLADVLSVRKGTENWRKHFNRTNQKHVDFLLAGKETLTPVAAIELDDASHNRKDRQERDAFVNEAFAAAGLPLVRQKASSGYAVEEVAASIESALSIRP